MKKLAIVLALCFGSAIWGKAAPEVPISVVVEPTPTRRAALFFIGPSLNILPGLSTSFGAQGGVMFPLQPGLLLGVEIQRQSFGLNRDSESKPSGNLDSFKLEDLLKAPVSASLTVIQVQMLYRMLQDSRIHPYFGLGAGVAIASFSAQDETSTSEKRYPTIPLSMATVRGGVDFEATDHVGLFIEPRISLLGAIPALSFLTGLQVHW